MDYFEKIGSTIEMIKSKELLHREQIKEVYNLDEQAITKLFKLQDFKQGISFAGKEYWYYEHIEMAIESLALKRFK